MDDVVNNGFDLTQLLNLSEEEATKLATAAGYKVRVSHVDGAGMVGTRDYNVRRVNLHLIDGVVSSYNLG